MNVDVELDDLLLVLLQMGKTEKCTPRHRCPAALLVARLVSVYYSICLLLTEVKSLTWVDLVPDARHEVLIGDATVLIFVEKREDNFALLLTQWEAPELKKVNQFALVNVGITILIEIFEGFAHGAPLLSNFVDKLEHDVSIGHAICRGYPLVHTLAPLLLFQEHLVLWISL